jgi:hypothetical protein
MMTAGIVAVSLCFIATGMMLTIVSGAVKKSPIEHN